MTLGVSVWLPMGTCAAGVSCVCVSLCVPKEHFSCVFPHPSCCSHSWVQRSWARGEGEGEVGGDGSEEIEHSVSGLNGRVSQRASGCQMMDGVGAILHPPEHRAPAPPFPQPPTLIPPSSLQSTFPHSGLGPSYKRGVGREQGPTPVSLSPNTGPAGGGEQLPALIPSLASLRSENSWAPGDKDQSLRGVCAQEKGKRIQKLLSWGKNECPPFNIHTHTIKL